MERGAGIQGRADKVQLAKDSFMTDTKLTILSLCVVLGLCFLIGQDQRMRKQQRHTALDIYCDSPGHSETLCANETRLAWR